MYKFQRILAIICICLPLSVFGQNYINTPYSRFSIGDLINTGFGYNRALGGSSIALRPQNLLNYLNPASYTSIDTNSFILQAGAAQRFSKINTTLDEDQSRTANIEYFTLGFPITKYWKFSAGLVPFSRVQYYFEQNNQISDVENILSSYKGDGGLNELYIGSAFMLGKNISIGANASYLFGSLDKYSTIIIQDNLSATSTSKVSENFIAHDFFFRIGLQAFKTINSKHHFILGLTYDNKIDIKAKLDEMQLKTFQTPSGNIIDTVKYVNDSAGYINLPTKIGVGLTYIYNERLVLTAEYNLQKFSEGKVYGEQRYLTDYSSYRFGLEYTPVPMSDRQRSSYFERIHYRIGGRFTNTYLTLNSHQITDYAFTVGLGLPWKNPQKLYTFSTFNLAYEYGVRGTTDYGLIKETYHTFTIGITLHDFWFFKPKYD